MKESFVKRFSYAAPLQASLTAGGTAAETYDQTMVDVVMQMQTRYGANPTVNPDLVVNGIMSFSWQVRCEFQPPPKITILTWQGTGVSMWDTDSPQPYGAALYVAKSCSNVVVQPVGNYPASINAPWMGTSVQMGVDSAVSLAGGAPPISPGDPVYPSGPIIPFGYSQGAICASHWWRDEVLNPSGRCHNRLNDVIAAATFGNPCRCPGKANGNVAAGWGLPGKKDGVTTGGISGPDCLTAAQTPEWWYDYVWLGTNDGATELYTNCPVGDNPWTAMADPGKVGNLIYNFVQTGAFVDFVKIAEALAVPVGMVEEIYNGLTFALAGPNADHFAYNWLPSIVYLTNVCKTWTNNYITSGGAVRSIQTQPKETAAMSLPSKSEIVADIAKVEEVVGLIAKYDSLLPIPASAKAGIAEFDALLKDAEAVASHV